MIEVDDLAVHAGGRILFDGLSLRVPAGEILAVLGPNGRGKTTFLRTVLALQEPAGGGVRLHGHAAYVPQQTDAPFSYDVLTMVGMGRARHLPWYATPGTSDLNIARACLRSVELEYLASRPFCTLSGGQRQLVCIARAMASESPIMLLDEPTAALDLRNQDLVLAVLRRMAKERGLAVVFSTHQPQHAQHIADQTLLMHEEACEVGTTATMCTDERLSRLYRLPVRVTSLHCEGREVFGVVPLFR